MTSLTSNASLVTEIENELFAQFENYLLVGGWPEYLKTRPFIENWHLQIKEDIVKRQLFIDLPKVFSVDNPEYLESILALVARNQAQQMLPNTFFEVLPIGNKQTVLNYLTYLEQSFLLLRIPQWTKAHVGKYHKMLVRDPGIAAMLTGTIDMKNTALIGRLVEAVVHQQAEAMHELLRYELRYFRDTQGHEVDGVILGKDYTLLYEVTYGQTDLMKARYRNLLYLATRKKGIKRVFLLTRTKYNYWIEDGIEIITIPVWFWLWLAPRMEGSN